MQLAVDHMIQQTVNHVQGCLDSGRPTTLRASLDACNGTPNDLAAIACTGRVPLPYFDFQIPAIAERPLTLALIKEALPEVNFDHMTDKEFIGFVGGVLRTYEEVAV